MSGVEPSSIRSDAIEMVNSLPEDATWDDLMYKIYVRQCVDAGLQDLEAGRLIDVARVRGLFELTQ